MQSNPAVRKNRRVLDSLTWQRERTARPWRSSQGCVGAGFTTTNANIDASAVFIFPFGTRGLDKLMDGISIGYASGFCIMEKAV